LVLGARTNDASIVTGSAGPIGNRLES
jgi:hypothetical protein